MSGRAEEAADVADVEAPREDGGDERLRPLRCPACKVTTETHEFGITIPYKAAAYGSVLGITADGRIAYDPIDRGDPDRFYRVQIDCRCGHQWTTSRDWTNRG